MSIIISLIISLVAFFIRLNVKNIENEKNQKLVAQISLLIGSLTFFYFLIQVFFRFLITIPAGKVGIVELWGKVKNQPLTPGVHLVNPFAEIIEFSTRLQDLKEQVSATSKEGLNIKIDVSLQYTIQAAKSSEIYTNIGKDEKEIVISRFRSIIRQITATYDIEDIYGAKRQEIATNLRQELQQQLAPLGITVEEALLRNVILPEKIQTSIQEKLAAQQESQKLDFEIQKTKKEAERKKIEAQGIAETQKLLSGSLTEEILKLKAIEATQKLAESDNTKVIIIGGGEDKLPLILQGN